jgi:hypothetical protein
MTVPEYHRFPAPTLADVATWYGRLAGKGLEALSGLLPKARALEAVP